MKSLLRLIAMAFAAAMLFAGPALAQNTKLYVGNLPFNTTEVELRDVFSAYGAVAQVDLMMNKETGRPRGFAFVTMQDSLGAEAAITGLNGKDFEGRILEVNLARPSEDRPPRSFNRGANTRKVPERQRF